MIDRLLIEHLLDIAVQAPSGDNAQPWQFKIEQNVLFILNVPGKDATLYNFQERGSFLAHGALIENICIIAPTVGCSASVELFPPVENCTAKITLTESPPVEDILSVNIAKRCSNRKPYNAKRPLEESDRTVLVDSVAKIAGVHIYSVGKDKIPQLADTICLNERLLFENKPLHDFLFGMIRWSREEEEKSPGLYVKTMEFPLPLQFLLRYVFSNFGIVEQLNLIGLSRFIPKQSAQIYLASSAFFAVTIENTSARDYVIAGRAAQRFWLTAEKQGVNVQPVSGIPYLAERIRAGEGEAFSQEHQSLILDADAHISTLFGFKSTERIAMLFRVGYGSNPTAKSLKFPPKILP